MPKETLSFTQLEQQYNSNVPAAVLVERSDKSITTGIYEGLSQTYPGYYDVAVDNGARGKALTAEQLSDAYQARLAEQLTAKPLRSELGEAAVHASVFIDRIPEGLKVSPEALPTAEVQPTREDRIEALSAQIDELTQGLSDDEKNSLFRHMTYKDDKIDAQRRGDGAASTLHGEYMGQEERAMSPRAQRVAGEYYQLMTNLKRLRDI